jgi:hypothetical protein
MGGYLSRSRRREDKKEKNSPRLEPIEAEPDQNEIEVDEKRYVENVPNVDDITVREEVEACQTSSCADSLEPDETPVEVISTAFDVIDPAPRSPLYPSPEEMLMDVNAEEQQDTDRQMRPCHSDVLSDTETKMENPNGISEVSHPLFKTNPSEAEVKEGEVGKAEKERHGRSSSPMFSDSVVNDSEADVTVDVQNLDPVFDSSLNREEEQTFLRNLDEEDVIEINVDEPQNDRLGSSPYRSGVILGPVLVDDEPEIIVDVLSEGSRPVFDPSIHLMAEPVIFHPQPVPMDDIIELELAIDDELVKRKKRTLQKSNNVHPESKESQPGLDDE